MSTVPQSSPRPQMLPTSVRAVVLFLGTTTKRRIYVIQLGTAPVLQPNQCWALSSYRISVGRPAVTLNIPDGLHIAFRSKVATEARWVHVRSLIGPNSALHWHIMGGSDPSPESPSTECSDAVTLPVVTGDCLRVCLQRFAAESGRRSTSDWVSPTDLLHSAKPNWLTQHLIGHFALAKIRPAPLLQPAHNPVLFLPRVAAPPTNPNPAPSSYTASDYVTRLRKRLEVSKEALTEAHKECKRLRQANERLHQHHMLVTGNDPHRVYHNHHQPSTTDTPVSIPATVPTSDLIAECVRRAKNKGIAPVVGLNFVSSFLENSTRSKNRWRWTDTDLAFFSNLQTRIGLHTYKFMSSEVGVPSVASIQRVASIDSRDLLFSSTKSVQRLAEYLDAHPAIPRRVLIQHNGIHVRQGVVWTKLNTFVGFVEQRDSLAHYVLKEPDLQNIEFACTAEVFLLSIVHSGVKHVVRVAPCPSAMSSLDYVGVLNEVLENLDCSNIKPAAICFDAATPVVKGLRSLASIDEDAPPPSHSAVDLPFSLDTLRDSPVGICDSANSTSDGTDVVHMFATSQHLLNRIALALFETTSVPAELLRSVARAHARFPVYLRDPYSKEAFLLCGDPAHLLKRDRNLLYSTRSRRRHVEVRDAEGLVHLNWKHLVSLRAEDKAAQLSGLPEQEPLLTDKFVTLSSWGKMSVPGALAVYSGRVIAALKLKAAKAESRELRRELSALARHLEIGRSRFDVARSHKLNLLRKAPLPTALTTYETATVDLMRELEAYYEEQLINGRTNSKSTVWAEPFSTSVAMRCFILRETLAKPVGGYVLLTRISTDPLESLFSFLRQTNGGSNNPTMEQLVQGLRRQSTRGASSQLLRCLKGNMEPERNYDLLNEVFLAGAIVGKEFVGSNTSTQRALCSVRRSADRDEAMISEIAMIANGADRLALDMRTRQVTARVCGAVVAIERNKLTKQINKLDAMCQGDPTKLRKTEREKLSAAHCDLRQITAWSLPSHSPMRLAERYDDIREVERHDGLTYPTAAVLHVFCSLVVLRHHAVEHVVRNRSELHRLPIFIARLFQSECARQEQTTSVSDVFRRIVVRFTNSSCKSLQGILNARCEEQSVSKSSLQLDATVALRSRLAVKSATAATRTALAW